jgi:hypothetical protein
MDILFHIGIKERTAALAPPYSGNVAEACTPIMLEVTTMLPPGVGFCRMKWTESRVPYMSALKHTSVQSVFGSGGSLSHARTISSRKIV